MKKIGLLIVTVSLILLAGCSGEVKDGKYAQVAQCLTEKGVKFYGAYWCPHCAEQKKLFGSDIRYITYVECDPKGKDAKPEECKAAGVAKYPTWFFPGQGTVSGVMDPEALAKKANCDADTSETSTETTAETQSSEVASPATQTETTTETQSSEATSPTSSNETTTTTETQSTKETSPTPPTQSNEKTTQSETKTEEKKQ